MTFKRYVKNESKTYLPTNFIVNKIKEEKQDTCVDPKTLVEKFKAHLNQIRPNLIPHTKHRITLNLVTTALVIPSLFLNPNLARIMTTVLSVYRQFCKQL